MCKGNVFGDENWVVSISKAFWSDMWRAKLISLTCLVECIVINLIQLPINAKLTGMLQCNGQLSRWFMPFIIFKRRDVLRFFYFHVITSAEWNLISSFHRAIKISLAFQVQQCGLCVWFQFVTWQLTSWFNKLRTSTTREWLKWCFLINNIAWFYQGNKSFCHKVTKRWGLFFLINDTKWSGLWKDYEILVYQSNPTLVKSNLMDYCLIEYLKESHSWSTLSFSFTTNG